ncbi:MAG: ATP-binding protein [Erysipelotrichaceae bacterium]
MELKELIYSVHGLCAYKDILKSKTGLALMELIACLEKREDFTQVMDKYNSFVYSVYQQNKKLSFKEAFVDDMLLMNNPFNISLEENGSIPDFIRNGIANELKYLEMLVEIDGVTLKNIMKEMYVEHKQEIDNFLEFGYQETYKAKNDNPYEAIKDKLMNNSGWANLIDDVIDFHAKNGTGRCTAYEAFVWERFENDNEGHLREIKHPDPVRLSDLIGYKEQKEEIVNNTLNFINGLPANNLLLYGSRGTGKSSTVKAVLNEFHPLGLRLIEVDKEQLGDFTRIIRLLRHKKQCFIIFVDDLVFDENEASYSALKTILEGRVENRPDNILIYATTNRRHLVAEKFSDGDDIHEADTAEEKLSLSDRFGITISFFTPTQIEFLKIVDGIVANKKLDIKPEVLHAEAKKWAMWHNGCSPRSANQFIADLQGKLANKNKK